MFACIFLISGCGKKISNSRTEFQQIASKVELDTERANVSEFEMYLPKEYIEYIPDSRKYTKTTVTLPSGKEKEVKCPYAQAGYKKNELEEFSEILDKGFRSSCTSSDTLNRVRVFINYKDKSVLYIMPITKTRNPKIDKVLDNILNLTMETVKKQTKEDSSYMKEYDLSSSETNISFVNSKQKQGPPNFVDLALVKNSTANAFMFFCRQDDTTYKDIIAILLSMKPNYDAK